VPTAKPQKQDVQYAAGLVFEPDTKQVLLSYGAADRQSRLLRTSLVEVELLFAGQQDRCMQRW
jgi:hypothetical protein